jgi:hypothetical protein
MLTLYVRNKSRLLNYGSLRLLFSVVSASCYPRRPELSNKEAAASDAHSAFGCDEESRPN